MAVLPYMVMLLAFLAIAFLWYWWFKTSSPIINWPILGMIPGLSWNVYRLHDYVTDILQKTGNTVLFKGPWFTGMDFIATCDPKNVHYILSKNIANYEKGPEYRDIVEPLGNGILNADTNSDIWRTQKRILHTLFNDKCYDAAVERVLKQKILEGLFQILEIASQQGSEVDLQDIIQRLTFDNVCLLVLGYDPNCLSAGFPQVPIEKAFYEMEEAVVSRYLVPASIWKLQRWLRIGQEKTLRKAMDTMGQFVDQWISRKREELAESKNQNQMDRRKNLDFLTYFLALNDDGDGQNGVQIKSDKFLKDMLMNLIGAGRDTIAAGLIWLFWLVGTHPQVEEKILEELKANLQGDKWKPLSFEEVSKLTYLHAVVYEALRLYPPVPFDHVVSVESDTLPSGHYIPKNMKVIYLLYTMGRMEEIWGKDHLEFKPERWISGRGGIKHVPSYNFIAFNAGPRTCLGKKSAIQQMKVVASAVVWNFTFQVLENQVVIPRNAVILYMKNGLKVRVFKRHAP